MEMTNHRRKLVRLLFFVAVASVTCFAQQSVLKRPRVVLLVVIDQMRFDYFQSYAAKFNDGFKRLATEGAFFTEARYPYASTKTAEAHALMLSGWSPSATGIVADQWYDRGTRSFVVTCASAEHHLTESSAEGGSPEQMMVHTVGDELKALHPNSIVLTASWKRYAAILNGGKHPDAAFWFDSATGHMVTSDYYMRTYPAWVKSFNRSDITAPYFGKTWLGHKLGTGAAVDEAYRETLRYTPYINDLLLDFATALLQQSGLGKGSGPDLVAISFSALDYIGHLYGPETPEFDATIQALDHQIGELLRRLDKQLGTGNYTLALTADHGVALLPEKEQARGHDAGRLNAMQFQAQVEKAVDAKLGNKRPVIAAFDPPELWLDYAAAAESGVSQAALERAVTEVIGAQPGITRAYTVGQVLAAGASNDPLLKSVAAGYFPGRSGDIHVLPKPNYIFWNATGSTHGTPYDYDAHVPLILFGSGIKPGRYREHVRMNDLAPTIGRLLGIRFKGDPHGQVLEQALQ